MSIRPSKRHPIRHQDDPDLEELTFCFDVKAHLYDITPIGELQARVREIVYRYGWNIAKYPPAVARTFWCIVTGDWWGEFRRTMEHTPDDIKLDPSSPHMVEYRC